MRPDSETPEARWPGAKIWPNVTGILFWATEDVLSKRTLVMLLAVVVGDDDGDVVVAVRLCGTYVVVVDMLVAACAVVATPEAIKIAPVKAETVGNFVRYMRDLL